MMNNNEPIADAVIREHPFLVTAVNFDLQKIANFLKNCDNECCIIRLWHPKVVQRSYGKEKRFFCPPPAIALLGNGWASNKARIFINLAAYRQQIQEDIISKTIAITVDEQRRLRNLLSRFPPLPLRLNVNVGINDGATPFIATIQDEIKVKNLHINSVDRRRFFKLSCEFTEYLGPSTVYPARFIGKFESSEVRVVSKPPKKQSVRAADSAYICLKSGMQVALFNRTRSQGIATRYLYAAEPNFVASTDHWSSFYIYAVNTDENADSDKTFVIRQGFICYNHVVRLVDVLTGISSPNLILRRVEKNLIQVAPQQMSEPVAMLQRVAFQFCDTASTYFGLSGTSIIQIQAPVINDEAHESHECVAWSITNCELIEYKFFEIMGPTAEPVSPIPFIKTAQLEGVQEHNAVIEFSGTNLGLHLYVYFGLFSSDVISANSANIRCRVPPLLQVTAYSEMGIHTTNKNGSYQVPISLIRRDGVIYPTDIEFQYSSFSAGEIGKIVFKNSVKFVDDSDDEEIDHGLEATLTEDERGGDESLE